MSDLPATAIPVPGSHLYTTACTNWCGATVVAAEAALATALCAPCRIQRLNYKPTHGKPNSRICATCGDRGWDADVHLYPTGHQCTKHRPPENPDFYGFAIPRGSVTHRPAADAPAWKGVRFLGPADPDGDIHGGCIYCGGTWPLHHEDHAYITMNVHERVHHDPDGWMVGGRGGVNDRVCHPCGGQSPGGTIRTPQGETVLPPRGDPLPGRLHRLARHDLCENGQRRGRNVITCGCRHHPHHTVRIKFMDLTKPCPPCARSEHGRCEEGVCGCIADHADDDPIMRGFKQLKRELHPERESQVAGGWTRPGASK